MPTISGGIPGATRWRVRVAGAGVAVAIAGATGWAGATVFSQPDDILVSSDFTTVRVVDGEIGSSLDLNAVAEWEPVPVGVNQAAGVITTVVHAQGAEASQGSILFTVNLRPVVIARGDVPAFRDIGFDAKGSDVAQLQTLLADMGYYKGRTDGTAGSQTVAAIKKWQKNLGLEESGTVTLGDVIFVPTLPSRVTLDADTIKRGGSLGGGESVVKGLHAGPSFTLPVSAAQASLMPVGTRVEITSPDRGTKWGANVVGQVEVEQSDTIDVQLGTADGSQICGTLCGSIPVSEQTLLSTRIFTVEAVKGLVVPSAAIVTTADGETKVIDAKGASHAIQQLASARGMSAIKGIESGMRVRVPAAKADPQ